MTQTLPYFTIMTIILVLFFIVIIAVVAAFTSKVNLMLNKHKELEKLIIQSNKYILELINLNKNGNFPTN